MRCANRHVEEETLIKGLSDGLERTGGEQRGFHGAVDGAASEREPIGRLSGREVHRIHRWAEPLTEMDTDFMLKTLDHIKVFEDGTLLVVFLDGTEIECKN